jgi:trehalose-6-phosphate synthase
MQGLHKCSYAREAQKKGLTPKRSYARENQLKARVTKANSQKWTKSFFTKA